MAETSPNKLARNYTLIGLFLFAAPSILLQLWTGIYQIFDTAIATNFNSTATLSAINIVYPAQAVVEAIAFLFSGGSAALLGKLLGEKKTTWGKQDLHLRASHLDHHCYRLGLCHQLCWRPGVVLHGR